MRKMQADVTVRNAFLTYKDSLILYFMNISVLVKCLFLVILFDDHLRTKPLNKRVLITTEYAWGDFAYCRNLY